MSFITFNYNKNLNYAFIYWALEIIYRSLLHFKSELFQVFKKDSVNEYYFVMLQNISFFFSGFCVLYIHCSVKKKLFKEDSKIISKKLGVQLISDEMPKQFHLTKNIIYKIMLGSAINYLNRLASFIFYQSNPNADSKNIFDKAQFDIITNIDIITRFIISIMAFKMKVHKHHFLSFIIIIIGFVLFILNDFLSINFSEVEIDKKLTYIYIGILSYRGILFPIEDYISKIVFITNYMLPEHYYLLRAIFRLLFFIILTPILYYTLWFNEDETFTLVSNTTNIIIISVIYCIYYFLQDYIILKVIYYFSVQSVAFLLVSESVTSSISEIIKYFTVEQKNSDVYKIVFLSIDIIIIFLTAFATFIYNEIIVIKVWGLDKNVASAITSRAISEVNQIIQSQQEDIDDNKETSGEENIMIELEDKIYYI